ncbi:hypothetical protein GPECTOR_28g768 [Gonium pectorale]|uniref:TRP C-terminal domain-containing protein n=1 Tax=Gonium pectorale TaxID=33097 RepID=A0A150GES5_GONPE|nr:hypothetical protein GPECTOR_28g768 [Gonium pectorale]|eukprot:KXZ48361.1 hypothetical protein GPECTOR_28g768 [Gonium pectorale]
MRRRAAAAATVAAAAGDATAPKAAAPAAAARKGGSLPATSTLYGIAYAVLWHGRELEDTPLVDRDAPYARSAQDGSLGSSSLGSSPAFVIDPLVNVNGSLNHSPGPRAGASLVPLPYLPGQPSNTDALLFGGLTAVNRSTDNPAGQPLLTNDVHYLRYIPAGDAAAAAAAAAAGTGDGLPPPRFPSCPFNSSGCVSRAPLPQGGGDRGALPPPPPPPPPAMPDVWAPDPRVPIYSDCPVAAEGIGGSGSRPRTGTFQLRVWRSVRRDVARGMGLVISSLQSGFRLSLDGIGRDVARGPCCPANSSRWAWPQPQPAAGWDTATATSGSDVHYYALTLPLELLLVRLVSGGGGWTAAEDRREPLSCNTTSAPERCPRIDLFSVDAGRLVAGMGQGATAVWEEPAGRTDAYARYLRLALCTDPAAPAPPSPPSPDASPDPSVPPPFPFHAPGSPNRLQSHELQLAAAAATAGGALPPPRHKHAAAFVETSGLSRNLGFGSRGLLVVYGGTTDPWAQDPDALLDDMWAFDLELRTWTRMPGGGDSPGPRMRHSMTADGSLASASSGSGSGSSDPDLSVRVDVDSLLALPRARVFCSPNSTWLIDAAPNLVNIEFVGCQLLVVAADGQPTVLENCVFRDTLGRPAVVVAPGGALAVRSCLFLRNDVGVAAAPGAAARSVPGSDGGGWRNGSAIYVLPYGRLAEVRDSLFMWNGASATAGGAIYLAGPGSCLDTLADSAFLHNGPAAAAANTSTPSSPAPSASTTTTTAAPTFVAGGAIAAEKADGCSITLDGLTLAGNGAATATSGGSSASASSSPTTAAAAPAATLAGRGGALYLAHTDSRAVRISRCRFLRNSARLGGAAYLVNVLGAVAINDSTLAGNTGQGGGGGLALEGVLSVSAARLRLANNSAPGGVGGAISHSRQGLLQLADSTLYGNTALYGGGLGALQDVAVSLSGVTLEANSATHGGGMECFLCYYVEARNVTFRANVAASAGGLSMMLAERGGRLEGCSWAGNVGSPPPPEAAALGDAGCSRDAAGGGGGACFTLRRSVEVVGGAFVNNTAVSGGALFVQPRCLPGDDACGPLLLSGGAALAGNAAVRGGGGALFRTSHNITNVTCASGPLSWEDMTRGCSEWYGNTASYGSVTATRAYGLRLLTPGSGRLGPYRSNDPAAVAVAVVDYHGQVIRDASSEAETGLEVRFVGQLANATAGSGSGNSSTSSATTTGSGNSSATGGGGGGGGGGRGGVVALSGGSVASVAGIGNFSQGLTVQAVPGTYVLQVVAPRVTPALAPAVFSIQVRPCVLGEVTNIAGDQCFPCEAGTFSLRPASLLCDPCPPNADCTLAGLPWATAPLDGFWHSGPYSPNMVPAVIKAALRVLANGSAPDPLNPLASSPPAYLAAYLGLQCAHGFRGTACGRCLPGYGKRGSGACERCAARWANVAFYLLSTMVNVVSIWLTVWAQIPKSAEGEDLSDDGDIDGGRASECGGDATRDGGGSGDGSRGGGGGASATTALLSPSAVRAMSMPDPDGGAGAVEVSADWHDGEAAAAGPRVQPPKRLPPLPGVTASAVVAASPGGEQPAVRSSTDVLAGLAPPLLMMAAAAADSPGYPAEAGARVADGGHAVGQMAAGGQQAVTPPPPAPGASAAAGPPGVAAVVLERREDSEDSGGEEQLQVVKGRRGSGSGSDGGGKKHGGGGGAAHVHFGGVGDGKAGGSRPGSPAAGELAGGEAEAPEEEEDEEEEDETAGPYKGGNHTVVIKVTSMVRQVAIPWPRFVTGLLSAAKDASQTVTTIVSVDCSLDEEVLPISIQRILITIATPYVILALSLVVWVLLFARHKMRGSARGAAVTFADYLQPRLTITTIAIVFYVYPDATSAILSLFSCQEVDPASGTPYTAFMGARGSYWSNDLDLECYVFPHLWLALAVGLPGVVLFCAGCPVFSWVWLRRHHQMLHTSPEFNLSYGFMYNDYSRSCYFWDSLVMLRKLGIVIVIVFLQEEGAGMQVLASLGIIIIATLAQISIKPFKHARMNELERLSLFATIALLYCALYFSSDIPRAAKAVIGFLLVVFNVVVIAFFVWHIAYEFVLGMIWTIDEHSNADGVLEWADVWAYVEDVHKGKRYYPLLVRGLKVLEAITGFFYSSVWVPLRNAGASLGRRLAKPAKGTGAGRSLSTRRASVLSAASARRTSALSATSARQSSVRSTSVLSASASASASAARASSTAPASRPGSRQPSGSGSAAAAATIPSLPSISSASTSSETASATAAAAATSGSPAWHLLGSGRVVPVAPGAWPPSPPQPPQPLAAQSSRQRVAGASGDGAPGSNGAAHGLVPGSAWPEAAGAREVEEGGKEEGGEVNDRRRPSDRRRLRGPAAGSGRSGTGAGSGRLQATASERVADPEPLDYPDRPPAPAARPSLPGMTLPEPRAAEAADPGGDDTGVGGADVESRSSQIPGSSRPSVAVSRSISGDGNGEGRRGAGADAGSGEGGEPGGASRAASGGLERPGAAEAAALDGSPTPSPSQPQPQVLPPRRNGAEDEEQGGEAQRRLPRGSGEQGGEEPASMRHASGDGGSTGSTGSGGGGGSDDGAGPDVRPPGQAPVAAAAGVLARQHSARQSPRLPRLSISSPRQEV